MTPPAFFTITFPLLSVLLLSSPHLSPQADLRVARPLALSALHQVYLPLEGSSPALAQRLQPVLILEPHTGLVHPQLVSGELFPLFFVEALSIPTKILYINQ